MNGIIMEHGNIIHRRGDTGVIRVQMKLYENAPPFRFREGDTATLTIKKYTPTETKYRNAVDVNWKS